MGTKAGNFTVVENNPLKTQNVFNNNQIGHLTWILVLWKNATFLIQFKYCGYFRKGRSLHWNHSVGEPLKKKSQETHITIVSSVLMSLQKEQKQFSEETYSCTELLTTIEKERKGRVAKEKKTKKNAAMERQKSVVYLQGKYGLVIWLYPLELYIYTSRDFSNWTQHNGYSITK